jgi:hypothetical protein
MNDENTNPTVPIEITLENFNEAIEQLRQTYKEHGYAVVKLMHPLKRLNIDLLSGEAAYFGKPEPMKLPKTKIIEMNTLQDLKDREEEYAAQAFMAGLGVTEEDLKYASISKAMEHAGLNKEEMTTKILEVHKTANKLPEPNSSRWILGFGSGISGHVEGKYAIMIYDGDWWNEDGTELCNTAPEEWAYL